MTEKTNSVRSSVEIPRISDMSGEEGARRVCVVVRDLYGANSLSDAAANALGLAQHLSSLGDDVTLTWVPTYDEAQKLDTPKQRWFIEKFAEQYLIKLEFLLDVPELSPHLNFPEKAALGAYYYVKSRQFDEVYFALEGGLGYYTLMAQELGLYAPPGVVAILVHSPTEWHAAADKRFLSSIPEIAVAHMERYCVENAAPGLFLSRFIESWCVTKGWSLPAQRKILPPFLPGELASHGSSTWRGSDELNLGVWPTGEFRCGIVTLCDALDRVAAEGQGNITLNVFGSFSSILGEHTGGMVVRRARSWPYRLRFFPKQSVRECLDYLKSRGGVSVVPEIESTGSSIMLASLAAGVPVVVSNTGANPEFIAPGSSAALCVPRPADLALRFIDCMRKRPLPAVPSTILKQAPEHWQKARNEIRSAALRRKEPLVPTGARPLVSIVIAHYERPQMLSDAIQSVIRQDYPEIEVVVVDDGSKSPEAKQFLKKLEPQFQAHGWKIIRQENKYLGAARNAGIRASRGHYVLFLDDDNALLRHAVSTFVTALETSRADICTSVSKIFLGPHIPGNEKDGFIEYVPLGGSLDLALLHDSFGDANAMMRREVFDRIGYLVEDRGFIASDWEFFTRAALHGLKIRIIPEATYWYRSSGEGMFRSAHWYETRLPILRLFREHGFKGLEHIYGLVMAENAHVDERKSYDFRLRYSPANDDLRRLNKMESTSNEAIDLLAQIAASEGRPDTAISLLAALGEGSLNERAWHAWLKPSVIETTLANEPLPPSREVVLDFETLRNFAVAAATPGAPVPRSFVQAPDRLAIETSQSGDVIAVLARGVPAGTLSLSLRALIDEATGGPVEVAVSVINPGLVSNPAVPNEGATTNDVVLGSSGWYTLERPFIGQPIDIQFETPTAAPASLVISVRQVKRSGTSAGTLVRFEKIASLSYLGLGNAARPRLDLPPWRPRARELADEDVRTAQLGTVYPGSADLLEFRRGQPGFFMRPSSAGVVVAFMRWSFPPFARSVVATVECEGDEIEPLDIAIALSRPSNLGKWSVGGPQDAVAFSGWKRITRGYERHEIEASLNEAHRFHLSICAAVRISPKVSPAAVLSHWRKFVVRW